ncbi:hypothetical protein TNCV_4873731 [Trichonephila clavipes]|nr:hypothetical protein TNCV_4873731 [Trichonephila clavipes]
MSSCHVTLKTQGAAARQTGWFSNLSRWCGEEDRREGSSSGVVVLFLPGFKLTWDRITKQSSRGDSADMRPNFGLVIKILVDW